MYRKLQIVTLTLGISLSLGLIMGGVAHAQTAKQDVCSGIGAANGTGTTDCSGGSDLNGVVTAVIDILSLIVGAGAVIMIIISGFRFVTSGGDSNNVSGAKNALIYALIGLVVVALAQALVHFVLSNTTPTTTPPATPTTSTSTAPICNDHSTATAGTTTGTWVCPDGYDTPLPAGSSCDDQSTMLDSNGLCQDGSQPTTTTSPNPTGKKPDPMQTGTQ